MRTFGFILIVVGILMIVMKGFSVQTDKKILDAGPIQIDKKENKWIGWPTYAGAAIGVVGLVLVLSSNKKNS